MATGAPSLLKPPASKAAPTLMKGDAASIRARAAVPSWGIFRNGKKVIEPDSFLSIGYRQDTKVSDHPLEDGLFETYNKVGTPYDIRVRMTKGGSDADRSAFLKVCEQLVNSFDVYDVVTPEKTYINANVQRYDYERSSTNGAGLLTVEFSIIEIRRFAVAKKIQSASASAADPVNGGRVQAQSVTNFVGRIDSGAAAPRAITNFVGVIK